MDILLNTLDSKRKLRAYGLLFLILWSVTAGIKGQKSRCLLLVMCAGPWFWTLWWMLRGQNYRSAHSNWNSLFVLSVAFMQWVLTSRSAYLCVKCHAWDNIIAIFSLNSTINISQMYTEIYVYGHVEFYHHEFSGRIVLTGFQLVYFSQLLFFFSLRQTQYKCISVNNVLML